MTDEASAMVRKLRKELNSGTVALVLLAILDQAAEPLYGYQIAKQLEEAAADGVPVKQGTLYPVLRSMNENGLLESSVEPSVSGPPRKYYTITAEGREVLEQWEAEWTRTRDFVDAVLKGEIGR
jgi:PadR family transcriptional regulator PadR